jgi:beta-xylosidase
MRAALLLGALLAGVPPAASAQEAKSVFAGADPDMEVAAGRYWIYPTGGTGLVAWSSPDMVAWTRGETLLRLEDIGWIDDDGAPRHHLWAPDMVRAKGGWYLYYSVGPQNPTPSRIGVAVCEGPAGPCTDSGRPLITGGEGFEAIDPAIFVDPKSGTPYLYAGGSAGATLRAWVLRPDMVGLDREVKVETPPGFTEGAFMHSRNGVYYLSWSSGRWDTASYQVHYAMAPSPTGPWRRGGPLLVGDRRYRGPGHHAFFEDPKDGTWYIAYHRWEGQAGDGPYRGERRIAIQKIAYGADGAILPIRMR